MKAYELKQWAYTDTWSEYFLKKEKAEDRIKILAKAQGYVVQPNGGYLLAVPDGTKISTLMIMDQKEINKRLADYGLYSSEKLENFPEGLVNLMVGMIVREIDIQE